MANAIVPKKSSVSGRVPATADLQVGEIAVNLADRKMYSKDSGGTVFQLGGESRGVSVWLNFDGTGATGAKTARASSGISAISKTATGRYAVTFSVAATSANYIFTGSVAAIAGDPPGSVAIRPGSATVNGCELNVYLPGLYYNGQHFYNGTHGLSDAAYIHGAFIGT